MLKVCKFGGTSMADKNAIERAINIVKNDPSRRFVVVSAPGKRFSGDEKVTDLLYKSFKERYDDRHPSFDKVRQRFCGIADELGVKTNIGKYLDEIEENIEKSQTSDYAASRGEYLMAILFADKLGWEFVDAAEMVKFDVKGRFDSESTNDFVSQRLKNADNAVISGFYGSMPDGSIKTFSRGGSDITGAIIARGVKADIYENWTDVNGFMTADPKIVKSPKPIEILSYEELRELSYMGASVLHPESIFPLRGSNIPINIRNTFEPENKGTTIMVDCDYRHRNGRLVTGIAGKPDYTAILIKKSMMNNELGFVRKTLSVLENYNIQVEHIPTGIDTMSIILESNQTDKETLHKAVEEIRAKVSPDDIQINEKLAMIAIVGHGMAEKIGTAARVFNALYRSKVNVKMIDQGSSEMNIIVGVANEDLNKSIAALYDEFFN